MTHELPKVLRTAPHASVLSEKHTPGAGVRSVGIQEKEWLLSGGWAEQAPNVGPRELSSHQEQVTLLREAKYPTLFI